MARTINTEVVDYALRANGTHNGSNTVERDSGKPQVLATLTIPALWGRDSGHPQVLATGYREILAHPPQWLLVAQSRQQYIGPLETTLRCQCNTSQAVIAAPAGRKMLSHEPGRLSSSVAAAALTPLPSRRSPSGQRCLK